MIICFNGVDGSGKSSQARRLVERLSQAGYPAVYVWCGGESSLTRPLTRLAQQALGGPQLWGGPQSRAGQAVARLGRRLSGASAAAEAPAPATIGAQYRGYLSTTRRLFRRPLVRGAWLNVALAEHAAEIWRATLPALLGRRIVICDRYIYDTILGVAVLAGGDAAKLPRLLRHPLARSVPRPSAWFFLDIAAGEALRRKDDIPDPAFLEVRVPLYRAAAAALGMQVIDATAPPEAIGEEIWRSVEPLLPGSPAGALRDDKCAGD